MIFLAPCDTKQCATTNQLTTNSSLLLYYSTFYRSAVSELNQAHDVHTACVAGRVE